MIAMIRFLVIRFLVAVAAYLAIIALDSKLKTVAQDSQPVQCEYLARTVELSPFNQVLALQDYQFFSANTFGQTIFLGHIEPSD